MCRLFGWASSSQVSAVELLGEDMERLRELSRLHQDGWGIATQGNSGLSIVREDVPAYESVIFRWAGRHRPFAVGHGPIGSLCGKHPPVRSW